ncbi:triphosphoribosyl-dephospho-CoA synthase [Rhizobacter sp. Root404]|uniref:triphosphoribosyl-dephospho-CoA synthase n=1 Tax=Rhizobacter sp. Root404 TaxID=1736528 RepID=UPI0007015094|nr:triphosphoribosyl-dephospho-CoA synthase [Rhizobacter sp. Root404]KQW40462.1 triphosphoribosyl-dephospho-CoA synthase [Rhizobacter sp. Root404]
MSAAPRDPAACYLAACELDVAVRKPGNVSRFSAGHRMEAAMFSASARASVGPLFRRGTRVGERVEAAVAATRDVVGCNTNLGILLLCAPIARAAELHPGATDPPALRAAVEAVLGDLDVGDTRAAYRAIAQARPGGLGSAAEQDVHAPPSIDLRAAMALAAERDSIARQYRDGFADLFEVDLPALATALAGSHAAPATPASAAPSAAVQRIYLGFLASRPDSHIVRKHGAALAHIVMAAAQPWHARALAGEPLDADATFAAWDAELKDTGLNPGTSADLTVATLFIAALLSPRPTRP